MAAADGCTCVHECTVERLPVCVSTGLPCEVSAVHVRACVCARVFMCAGCWPSICVYVLMQVRMGSPQGLGTSAERKGNGAVDADVETSRGAWGAAGT
jgi:hypothetical protein